MTKSNYLKRLAFSFAVVAFTPLQTQAKIINETQIVYNASQDRAILSHQFYLTPRAKKKAFIWFGIADAGRLGIDLGYDVKKEELRTVGVSVSRLYDFFGRSGLYVFDRESAYHRYQKYDKTNPNGYLFEVGVGYEYSKTFSHEFSAGWGESNDGTQGSQYKFGLNFRW